MPRILIVDDEFAIRKVLNDILKRTYECDMAASGKDAIEAYNLSIAEGKPYDCILLDVHLTDMIGVDVLRKIRENEQKAGISVGDGVPVIMATGDEAQWSAAFKEGCDDYIVKPVESKPLLEKIKRLMEKQ